MQDLEGRQDGKYVAKALGFLCMNLGIVCRWQNRGQQHLSFSKVFTKANGTPAPAETQITAPVLGQI